jgi:hypothetical protein
LFKLTLLRLQGETERGKEGGCFGTRKRDHAKSHGDDGVSNGNFRPWRGEKGRGKKGGGEGERGKEEERDDTVTRSSMAISLIFHFEKVLQDHDQNHSPSRTPHSI